jgi:hypothetical protein
MQAHARTIAARALLLLLRKICCATQSNATALGARARAAALPAYAPAATVAAAASTFTH